MRILSFDTSTSACSSALLEDDTVLQHFFEEMPRGQSEALMPLIQNQMHSQGWTFNDLDLIAVTTGPGAFTGLRIGLAAARGLKLASGLPCMGLSTFDVLAAGLPDNEPAGHLVVAIESKRADVFVQLFDGQGLALGAPLAIEPEKLSDQLPEGPLTVIGDAQDRTIRGLQHAGRTALKQSNPRLPDAAVLGKLAFDRWTPGMDLTLPSPLYLRPPDAKLPKHGGMLRP